MKNNHYLFTLVLLVSLQVAQAQTSLQNNGVLYLSGSSDTIYVSGSLANASGAGLTNNGNLYVLQNLSNAQAAMAAGSGTLYLSGTTAQSLIGTQLFKTFNLITNNAAGITLNNDLSVAGAHNFLSGVITSSATPNYLQYEVGSSYTGAADNRHVKGWVRKTGATPFTFPVGNGTVIRTIAIRNLSALSVFNANYAGPTTNAANTLLPLVTVDQNEYWFVNQVSGGTAVIDMNWDNSRIAMPPYAVPDIRVANYIASKWTQEGGSAVGNTSTTGTISSNTLGSFGAFTFGSITYALPVDLLQFSAYNSNGYALVNWTTSDEINVSHYDIQRSDDGSSFYLAGSVAARNLTTIQQYTFTDRKPLQAAAYYRLRSVDLDGKSKTSKTVLVSTGRTAEPSVVVVNPAHSSIYLNFQNLQGKFGYRIHTIAGRTVQSGDVDVAASGLYKIPVTTSLAAGVYIIELQKSGFYATQKLLIQ